MKKMFKLGAVAITLTLLLSACGGKTDTSSSTDGSQSSKVLNLMEASEIGSMDTIFTQDEPSINAQSNVFEGLYQLDENDVVIPAVAKDYQKS